MAVCWTIRRRRPSYDDEQYHRFQEQWNFYEGKNTLVINPEECIDCGVCEPECPEEAIIPDHQDENNKWLDFNTKWCDVFANITKSKDPMPDYEKHSGEEGKLEKYFRDE